MFGFIKEKIKKVYNDLTTKLSSLFSRTNVDQEFVDELTALLLSADTGVTTTATIVKNFAQEIKQKGIQDPQQVRTCLENVLSELLVKPECLNHDARVIMVVGVNGTGKTTFVAKLAHRLKKEGKKVLIVAGDTFRAAATQQLQVWADRIGVKIFIGREGQDPASVVFDGCTLFEQGGFDRLIIDTAGRLQTKVNLMKELSKINSIIARKLSSERVLGLLTVDAMLGQNSLRQAEVFHGATDLHGIVLTKLDGTGKGGIVFSIVDQFKLPVVYVTYGEGLDDMEAFDAREYVRGLLNK